MGRSLQTVKKLVIPSVVEGSSHQKMVQFSHYLTCFSLIMRRFLDSGRPSLEMTWTFLTRSKGASYGTLP